MAILSWCCLQFRQSEDLVASPCTTYLLDHVAQFLRFELVLRFDREVHRRTNVKRFSSLGFSNSLFRIGDSQRPTKWLEYRLRPTYKCEFSRRELIKSVQFAPLARRFGNIKKLLLQEQSKNEISTLQVNSLNDIYLTTFYLFVKEFRKRHCRSIVKKKKRPGSIAKKKKRVNCFCCYNQVSSISSQLMDKVIKQYQTKGAIKKKKEDKQLLRVPCIKEYQAKLIDRLTSMELNQLFTLLIPFWASLPERSLQNKLIRKTASTSSTWMWTIPHWERKEVIRKSE